MMTNTSGALWSVRRFTTWQKVGLPIFLIFFFILACAFRSASDPVILSQTSNGKAITVAPNTTIVVQLVSNPSTGYSWSITPPMSPLLRLQSQHFIAPTQIPGRPPRFGVPGTEVFTFLAVGTGTAQLRLAYRRPWEKTTPPTTTFLVTIHILPPPHHTGGKGSPMRMKPLSN